MGNNNNNASYVNIEKKINSRYKMKEATQTVQMIKKGAIFYTVINALFNK